MSWKTIKVGDFGKVITGNTPPKSRLEFYGKDYKFIKPTDMEIGMRYTPSTEECYSVEGFKKYEKSVIPPLSTCVVTIGSIGKKITLSDDYCFVNQAVNAVIPNLEKFDPHFVFYALKNILNKVKSADTGASSGRENVSKSNFSGLTLDVPENLDTQQKIASILSAYDDLIENNLKRIRLLEEAAQHLYREWFVRFRFPGWEEVKVVDGLPEGWERKAIGAVCETVGGGTPSTKEPKFWDSGEVIWFSPTDLSKNSSLVLLDSASKITEEGLKSSSAKMLPPRTILMSSRATIGLFGIISKPCSTNQGFISIIPNEEYFRFYLLFNLLNRKQEIINNANGSTFKEISKKHFREMEIIMPTSDLTKQFHYLSESFLNQIENLECQNQNLKKARDILLPRLMNQTLKV